MIWDEQKVNELYESGDYRRTVHKHKVVLMRQEHNGPIVAIETQRKTYYAGQKYDIIDYNPEDGDIRWGDYLGDYYISMDKNGKVLSIQLR